MELGFIRWINIFSFQIFKADEISKERNFYDCNLRHCDFDLKQQKKGGQYLIVCRCSSR